MKVVILCGGFGSRIRDVNETIPKPMIPIGPYPILWHVMKRYAKYGFKDFILCLGYKGEVIRSFFHNYERSMQDSTVTLGGGGVEFHGGHDATDWRVTLAETGEKALTGARVRKIRKYIGDDENFFLTYGDGVGDVDIDKLLAFHRSHGKVLTVTAVRPPGRFGELVADASGLVTEFNEKPQATAGRISGGFFVCRRELFDYLDEREDLIFEREPMNTLVVKRQMSVFEHNGFWQPMDTSREYQLLNELYDDREAPWLR
ncbi:MAG: glucose-1-phosphate cytidylyltransferase [Gemmatimonadaceae bacterium]|nr:glucose-1-phosphate cytidylyltransferase [Gemmatimonadaceae bacterium]